jgi:exodeoxyribonuclease VII large subunit
LTNNLEVVFLGRLNLAERYGSMRFQVDDIDVQALRVDSMVKVAEIRATLISEGIWQLNRELPLPTVPLRIGLVTSSVGAVKSDFERPLQQSGFAFQVFFFAASVAGQSAKVELPQAIRDAGASDCDVIVVIRGGGSAGDLAVFNDENVVRAVAVAKKPVLCAIGHSTDRGTVLIDEVAHRSFDVPQSVATSLVQRVGRFHDDLVGLAQQAVRSADMRLRSELSWAHLVPSLLYARVASLPEQASYRLDGLAQRVLGSTAKLIQSESMTLETLLRSMRRGFESVIEDGMAELNGMERAVDRHDVMAILDRGFVVLHDASGRMVRRSQEVSSGERVAVMFRDGSRRAIME